MGSFRSVNQHEKYLAEILVPFVYYKTFLICTDRVEHSYECYSYRWSIPYTGSKDDATTMEAEDIREGQGAPIWAIGTQPACILLERIDGGDIGPSPTPPMHWILCVPVHTRPSTTINSTLRSSRCEYIYRTTTPKPCSELPDTAEDPKTDASVKNKKNTSSSRTDNKTYIPQPVYTYTYLGRETGTHEGSGVIE